MKINILITIIVCVFTSYSSGQILKPEAIRIVEKHLYENEIKDYILYCYDSITNPSSIITTQFDTIESANFNAWVFFVDKQPGSMWSHPCSYIYVNLEDGTLVEKKAFQPPKGLHNWNVLTEDQPKRMFKPFTFEKLSDNASKSGSTSNDRYAVLISGGGEKSTNYCGFWNSTSAVYKSLASSGYFMDSNVTTIMSDGTSSSNDRRTGLLSYDSSPLDLDGDGDSDIDYSASPSNISTVFNDLKCIVDNDDYVFIYITTHGSKFWEPGYGYYHLLTLWSSYILDYELADEIDKLNAGHIKIIIDACYSGGFIDDLTSNNRAISTSSAHDKVSYFYNYDSYSYTNYTYLWLSAVNGEDPINSSSVNADSNSDGYISMYEAYDYVKTNDTLEVPQYYSEKYTLGENLTLKGKEICVSTDYFHDIELTSDDEVYDCYIDIKNVNISNNSDVVFDAEHSVIIQSDFSISLGSTLIIE